MGTSTLWVERDLWGGRQEEESAVNRFESIPGFLRESQISQRGVQEGTAQRTAGRNNRTQALWDAATSDWLQSPLHELDPCMTLLKWPGT